MSNNHAPAPILVVIDPTREEQRALQRATELARRTGAPLVLLACVFDPYLAGEQRYGDIDVPKLRRGLVERHMARLRELARPLLAFGLKVTCRAVFDHPLHEGIVREAGRHGAGLVIKDTHRHGALSRVFFTNTDWELIRTCPCPLWLVKPEDLPPRGSIIAAVDPLHEHDKPAELDRRIIRQAQELGVLFEERVHLIHAFNPVWSGPGTALPGATAVPVSLQPDVVRAIETEHQTALDRLAADTGFPAGQVHLRLGDPAEILPAAARELSAAVLVMGAVARSRLQRAFIGSTAERVLDDLPCDVVVVKPAGFTTSVSSRGKPRGYLARTANLAPRNAAAG